MTSPYNARLADARKGAREANLDALLITPGPSLRYLTGYAAVALERLTCLVVAEDGDPVLVVPRLEEPAAAAALGDQVDLKIRAWDETDDPFDLVAGLLGGGAQQLGVADDMTADKVLRIKDAVPNVELALAGQVLGTMRLVKDATEIAALREAGAAIDRVHARVPEWLRVGRREDEVGRDIANAIIEEGHVTAEFVIVASGPNGASPHHETGHRVIEDGDAVVVDIGGITAAGYCSDCTRTYTVGAPSAEFEAAYAELQQAQEAAFQAVRPGVAAEDVDAVARAHLTDAGLGDYFIHRTGHGIGLDVHEDPYIVAGNTRVLEPGMAFSIEPGFYVPDTYGARIEDIVVVTDEGAERLNVRPHQLIKVL